MTGFLLVRFLLVCYNSAMQCIEYIYMTKKSTWFPEAKPKKPKKYTKYFPFFCSGYFRSFFNVLVTFPNVFSSTKTNPKNNTPPTSSPRFVSLTKKKWPGKRRIFQSTFTKPKGIVQPMVGVFFSIKNTLFLVEIHHFPGGCGRIMLDFFLGGTF